LRRSYQALARLASLLQVFCLRNDRGHRAHFHLPFGKSSFAVWVCSRFGPDA